MNSMLNLGTLRILKRMQPDDLNELYQMSYLLQLIKRIKQALTEHSN